MRTYISKQWKNRLSQMHFLQNFIKEGEYIMNFLERIEELMSMGWSEESASREAYAEFYPESYDPEDYND